MRPIALLFQVGLKALSLVLADLDDVQNCDELPMVLWAFPTDCLGPIAATC